MIKNREAAAALAKAAEELIRELFRVAQPPSDDPVASEDVRRRLVQLIGEIETQLLGPLYKQHPELEPAKAPKILSVANVRYWPRPDLN